LTNSSKVANIIVKGKFVGEQTKHETLLGLNNETRRYMHICVQETSF